MSRKVIHQMTATMSMGDAISNEVLAIKKILDDLGIKNEIYAENIDSRLRKNVKRYKEYKENNNDIILNHFGIGSPINDFVANLNNNIKIIRYHNITPSEFFDGYSITTKQLCETGRNQLKDSSGVYKSALAVSEYNKQELVELGYKNTKVIPIIMALKDYEKKPDEIILNKYKDSIKNIVFVGRISPNKKQEDVIKSFYYYKKYFNKDCRLFIVGNYNGMERYYNQLMNLVESLELKDVIFTGHTKFNEILAYYSIADLFLCMSEHEGFCVPLVESMFFKIPILAYNSCAIPFTLDGSSVLINKKDYKYIAAMMDYILENDEFKKKIISKQLKRLEELKPEKVEKEFKKYLMEI